jgi:putative transposase
VIDCFSRRVAGWSVDSRIDSALGINALRSALQSRPFHNLVLHSDRGSQFTCREYADFLQHLGITASMSRKGNCWDNAVVESFFASIKVEFKPERSWKTRAQARAAIAEYIDGWYNPRRRHSANQYLSPVNFEKSQCVI